MAEVVGLSIASASIAAVQLIASLRSISSPPLFKASLFNTPFVEEFKVLQVKYQTQLDHLQAGLQRLPLEGPDSPPIPMLIFEEMYQELKNQVVALQSMKLNTPTARQKRLFERFIAALQRYSDLLLQNIDAFTLRSSTHLSLPPERYVLIRSLYQVELIDS
jgi:hypothetical protein